MPCNITAISELNSGKVYAVSPEGILYANFNPTNIRHINEGVIAESYSLHQNYPNPFNPTTKINFDLKNSAFALLRVYDITGSEVRTLVNEKLSAGSYSYDFNASELPSGVYFYQLQADGFVETKKMILLK
ncbi:MAG: T9SS type A sorting domain-containing protein [Ignavibacteria bacterium]|nr:T9SS type A sorting domain-containing protein [Ignavibacteria bacterium]